MAAWMVKMWVDLMAAQRVMLKAAESVIAWVVRKVGLMDW